MAFWCWWSKNCQHDCCWMKIIRILHYKQQNAAHIRNNRQSLPLLLIFTSVYYSDGFCHEWIFGDVEKKKTHSLIHWEKAYSNFFIWYWVQYILMYEYLPLMHYHNMLLYCHFQANSFHIQKIMAKNNSVISAMRCVCVCAHLLIAYKNHRLTGLDTHPHINGMRPHMSHCPHSVSEKSKYRTNIGIAPILLPLVSPFPTLSHRTTMPW